MMLSVDFDEHLCISIHGVPDLKDALKAVKGKIREYGEGINAVTAIDIEIGAVSLTLFQKREG